MPQSNLLEMKTGIKAFDEIADTVKLHGT